MGRWSRKLCRLYTVLALLGRNKGAQRITQVDLALADWYLVPATTERLVGGWTRKLRRHHREGEVLGARLGPQLGGGEEV